jgi:peptidyl-prolyl cis-trans isomerase SurA
MQREIDASSSSLSGDMGQVTLSDLNPTFQSAVSGLSVGELSPPLALGNIIALVMVCEREEGDITLPDDAQIEGDLSLERLDMLQKRYLRDLRAAAFIDRRTEPEAE